MNSPFIQINDLSFLFLQNPDLQTYFTVFILYIFLCIPFVIFLMLFIPKRFQQSGIYMFLNCLIWSVFIPIFGPIVLMIGVFLVHFYSRHYTQVEVATTIKKQLGSEKFVKLAPHAAGWAHMRITNDSFPKGDRERALYAINKQRTQQANEVNRALLEDNTYEIRLFAFNALNKQQTLITNAIKNYLDIKEQINNSSTESAQVNKSLAYLYWEYYLLNINLKELANEILNKAQVCATNAIHFFSTDSNLWLLIAKIFKSLNQHDKYRSTLEKISGFDYVPGEVNLDLASLDYEDHRYDMIRTYLGSKTSIYDISANASLIKFWCPHE